MKKKLNDTISGKDSSASPQDPQNHSAFSQSMQSGLGIEAQTTLNNLKEQERTNETPKIDFNKAKSLFGSSENLTYKTI